MKDINDIIELNAANAGKKVFYLDLLDSGKAPNINPNFYFRTKAVEGTYNYLIRADEKLPMLVYDKYYNRRDNLLRGLALNYTDLCAGGKYSYEAEDRAVDICRDISKNGIVAFVITPKTKERILVLQKGEAPKNALEKLPDEQIKTYIVIPNFVTLETKDGIEKRTNDDNYVKTIKYLMDTNILSKENIENSPLALGITGMKLREAGYLDNPLIDVITTKNPVKTIKLAPNIPQNIYSPARTGNA